jgi:lantibiotic modifying enzyme
MKMNAEQQLIAAEVFRIAEELMDLSQEDEKGIYWITPAPDVHSKAGESIDLFNGSAGIIVFFLTLYRYRPDPRYLALCMKAAQRLLQHPDVVNPKYYTFYGGAAGILYLCALLFKVTGDDSYLKKAVALEKTYRKGFADRLSKNDLLSGRAGNLLAVCHLYASCPDPSLLETIHTLIQKLVQDACITPAGLKWDLHKNAYDSLAGFSHGAAGIAFALLQTGLYFKTPGLIYVAEQALLYEMNYFDADTGNWMDLRVGVDRMQELRKQYNRQLLQWTLAAFQPTMSGINSWAHGAAGCGIARLSAFEITGNPEYARLAQHAMEYSWLYFTRQQHIDYSLCSGYGGIAAFFQQAATVLQQPSWRDKANSMALAAITYYKENKNYNSKLQHVIPDPGLFSGLAGVGFWMLGCLQQHEPDAIIHPRLPGNGISLKDYSISAIRQSIFSKYFPETLQQITGEGAQIVDSLYQSSDDLLSFEKQLEVYISNSQGQSAAMLPFVFKREQQIAGLWKRYKGLLQFRQRVLIIKECITECKHWPDELWLKQALMTVPYIEIIEQPGEVQQVVYCTENGLTRIPVPRIAALLLQACRQPGPVAALIDAFQRLYFAGENREGVEKLLLQRVKELVMAGLLTKA